MKLDKLIIAAISIGVLGKPSLASPKEITYKCADKKIFKAVYAEDDLFLSSGNKKIHMRSARSASGARYVGGGRQWWEWHGDAYLSRLTPGEAASGEPAKDIGQTCKPVKLARG